MTSKFQRKLLYTHMRIEGRSLPGGKVELRTFISNGSNRDKKMQVSGAIRTKRRHCKNGLAETTFSSNSNINPVI